MLIVDFHSQSVLNLRLVHCAGSTPLTVRHKLLVIDLPYLFYKETHGRLAIMLAVLC